MRTAICLYDDTLMIFRTQNNRDRRSKKIGKVCAGSVEDFTDNTPTIMKHLIYFLQPCCANHEGQTWEELPI